LIISGVVNENLYFGGCELLVGTAVSPQFLFMFWQRTLQHILPKSTVFADSKVEVIIKLTYAQAEQLACLLAERKLG
jgi:hypothetical protein